MRRTKWTAILCASLFAMSFLAACSGGGNAGFVPLVSTPSTTHVVTISWAANREHSVNMQGGYYEVAIIGQQTFTVPYTATSASTVLATGTYKVTLRAHGALDSQGSTTGAGAFSAPSTILTVNVP